MLTHLLLTPLVLALVRIVSHALPEPFDLCPVNMCASDETCCKTKNAYYACCPVPKATCCLDGSACCPVGYACNNTTPPSCVRQHAHQTTNNFRRQIFSSVRSRNRSIPSRYMPELTPNIAHGHTTNNNIPMIQTAPRTDGVISNFWKKVVHALQAVFYIYSRSVDTTMSPEGKPIHEQTKTQISLDEELLNGNSVNHNVHDITLCGNSHSVCVDHHPCCNWTTNMCCYYYEGVCCPDLDNICCPMGYVCDPTAAGICRVPY